MKDVIYLHIYIIYIFIFFKKVVADETRLFDESGGKYVDSFRNMENVEDIKITVDRAKAK